MIKIDLHTHSSASKDGGITMKQYEKILNTGLLDILAITDHDRIDFAQNAQQILGSNRIIVGQEITTTDGDIIGLYLDSVIPTGLTAQEAINEIKAQNGIVCIPHPFETLRKGLNLETINKNAGSIDLIEAHNGRAFFQNFSKQSIRWADQNNVTKVASSDAHGYKGIGRTYTIIEQLPNDSKELIKLLNKSKLVSNTPPLISLTYPLKNKILKKINRTSA